MSDSDLTTLLREHVCRYWGPASFDDVSTCECGWSGEDWCEHVTAVLSGVYAITPLPPPDPFGRWVVSPFFTQYVEVSDDKMVGIVDRVMPDHGFRYSPERAIILGAAMCAAARAVPCDRSIVCPALAHAVGCENDDRVQETPQ